MATNYMMQPLNPGPSFTNTMQMVQGINQLRDQKNARQLAEEQAATAQTQAAAQAEEQARLKEEFGAAFKAANDNPTAENRLKLADLHAQYSPEKAKAFRENWATYTSDRQQSILRDSVNTLAALETNPEFGLKMLQEQKEAAVNSKNIDEAKKYQTLIDMINVGPEALQSVKRSLEMTIGLMPGGKEAIEGVAKLGEENRTAAAEPTVQRQRLLDAGKTEAETNKIMAEIKKLDAETKNLAIELAEKDKAGGLTPKNVIDTEIQLNNTVNTRTAASREAETSFNNIKAGAAVADGVGDLAVINTFMRLLSPGIVTGQDYESATKSGGLLDELKTLKAQVEKGELLSKGQRDRFVSLSKTFMENAKKQNEEQLRGVRSIVKNYNLNEENVFGKTETKPTQDLSSMKAFLKAKWPDEAAKIDSLDLAGLQSEYKNTLSGYNASPQTVVEADF